ncbi:MAG: sugar kinase [Defluviitaleaceae bacterium]|nr:sugar kinase [Defluviitaleaceae bacterium]
MKKKILLMGEPMALLIAEKEGPLEEVENFKRAVAGAEVNVCIGLTRLGHDAIYVTRLGRDPFGYHIKKFLEKENIITQITFDDTYKTGIMLKSKVSTGDPSVSYYRKFTAASYTDVSDIEKIDFSGIDYVHITGILPALSTECLEATSLLMEIARKKGAFITFDPNLRPSLWSTEEEMVKTLNSLAYEADLVLPGLKEGHILTGETEPEKIADFYVNNGVKKAVVKLGSSEGTYVRDNSQSYVVPGFAVEKVVDTVGAGDGFAAGLISGIAEGLELKEAVCRGNALGAIQVTHISDNEGLPTRSELEKFMTNATRRG